MPDSSMLVCSKTRSPEDVLASDRGRSRTDAKPRVWSLDRSSGEKYMCLLYHIASVPYHSVRFGADYSDDISNVFLLGRQRRRLRTRRGTSKP
jgi:hypothetical protein